MRDVVNIMPLSGFNHVDIISLTIRVYWVTIIPICVRKFFAVNPAPVIKSPFCCSYAVCISASVNNQSCNYILFSFI